MMFSSVVADFCARFLPATAIGKISGRAKAPFVCALICAAALVGPNLVAGALAAWHKAGAAAGDVKFWRMFVDQFDSPKAFQLVVEALLERGDRVAAMALMLQWVSQVEFTPLEEVTEEKFHKHFDVNVLGLLLVTQEALKHFNPAGGSIINISSGVSSVTPPNFSVYTGTKGAVDAITRTLAKELGPRGIRVNAINPGLVITEGVTTAGFDQSDFRKTLESQTPLGRIGQTEDIAPAAVFFASSDSKWITGETLLIAGGLR